MNDFVKGRSYTDEDKQAIADSITDVSTILNARTQKEKQRSGLTPQTGIGLRGGGFQPQGQVGQQPAATFIRKNGKIVLEQPK